LPAPEKTNKAKMAQERSRLTRQKIVKAAVQLWTKRGFDEGFDSTTVDEIADNAAISRATVYYYFPKKEDILRELAWVTSDALYSCALRAMMSGQHVESVFDEVMVQLGTKVSKTERAMVNRMLQVRGNVPEIFNRDVADGLARTFSVIISHAQEVGDLPKGVRSMEMAEILAAICTAAITKWSFIGNVDLVATLRRRAAFVLAGAKVFES
jgi:AcrR family transcriptional regulator